MGVQCGGHGCVLLPARCQVRPERENAWARPPKAIGRRVMDKKAVELARTEFDRATSSGAMRELD
jgi:hypothetical protein